MNIDPNNTPAVKPGDIVQVYSPACNQAFNYTITSEADAGWKSVNAKRPNPQMPSGFELATLSVAFSEGRETLTLFRK